MKTEKEIDELINRWSKDPSSSNLSDAIGFKAYEKELTVYQKYFAFKANSLNRIAVLKKKNLMGNYNEDIERLLKEREQVEQLKVDWLTRTDDYDLAEYYEGLYDEETIAVVKKYKGELSKFQLYEDLRNERLFNENEQKLADGLGLSLSDYKKMRHRKNQADSSSRDAKNLLKHYFALADVSVHGDYGSEIEEIVNSIIDAAVHSVEAALLASKGNKNTNP